MLKKTLKSKRGGKVYVAFIDYKKALDTVDHEKSWETLQKLKTSAKMVNVLKFMHLSIHVYNGVLGILSSLTVLLGWSRTAYLARWLFSHLISEVADLVWENGSHGIQLLPGLEKISRSYCCSQTMLF